MEDLPLNLYHLRLFCDVVEAGGYSAAAQRLCVTQPALSIQIKSLERALGVRLFNRKGHRVQLTEIGEVVYQEALHLLQLDKKLKRTVQEYLSGELGYLSISSNHPVGRYLLPQYVIRFVQLYPKIEISITYENSDAVLRSVLEGSAHLGFVSWSPQLEVADLTFHHIYRDRWTLVCGPHWPAADREYDLEDLVRQAPFISLLPQTAPGKLISTILRRKGISANYTTFLRSGDIESIKTAVMSQLGIAFLPHITIQKELQAGELRAVRLRDPESEDFLLDYYLIRKAETVSAPSMSRFLELFEPLALVPTTV
jgi:DNA-binding transcriptional LysR family regulator